MSKYEQVPISTLKVDERYQRDIDQRHIKKIAEDYDEALLGVLEVSRRTANEYVVFDGQHRLEVLRLKNKAYAPCIVHENLTPEQEADLFKRLQDGRKQLTPIDRFKARLFAGDPTAISIKDVLGHFDLKVGTGPGTVNAVVSVERAFRRGNLSNTFQMLNVWRGDKGWLEGSLIDGLSRFLDLYPDADRDHAQTRWQEISPTVVLRRSTEFVSSSKAGGVLEVLRDVYVDRSHRLPEVQKAQNERVESKKNERRRYRRVTLEEVRDAAIELKVMTAQELAEKLSISKVSLVKKNGFLEQLVNLEILEKKKEGSTGRYKWHYVPPLKRPTNITGRRKPPEKEIHDKIGTGNGTKRGAPVSGTGRPMIRPGGRSQHVRKVQESGRKVVQKKK